MPSYLAIEISESEAKILQIDKTRREPLLLEAAFSVDLSSYAKDEEGYVARGARIRDVLRDKKLTSQAAAIIIPKQQSIVRVAELPSLDPVELASMAAFKAEEYIPFNAERHIVSNAVLRTDETNGISQVLITAVDGPVMEKALLLCREARIEPLVADVSSVALLHCFAFHEPDAYAEPSIVLINIGRGHTDVSILKNGVPVTTRSHTLGIERLNKDMERAALEEPPDVEPQDIATARIREWIEKIVRFTRQTYEVAAREHEVKGTENLYISGEGSMLSGLSIALEQGLGVKVHRFNPIEAITRAVGATVQPDVMPGMNTPLGTILRLIDEEEHPRNRHQRINLLPDEVIEEQEASERRILLMISGTMLFITLLLLYLAYDRQNRYNGLLEARLRRYNQTMAEVVETIEEKQNRIAIIERVTSDRTPAMAILDKLSSYPAMGSRKDGGRITLSEFRYSTGNEVSIAGTALEPNDINLFTGYLESMAHKGRPIFSEVGIPANTPYDMPGGRGTVWSFALNARLNSTDGDSE